MKLAANIFKAYDIRGIYGKELTLDAIGLIAKSISIYTQMITTL